MPPWQLAVRAVAAITGLVLLLFVDVHGALFYVAWSMIVFAVATELLATLVHWQRSRSS
ncbi:MAG TPA: hypothetical protein VFZ89_00035 [Solirubrobacteraceae bacterium]